jgi:hypothetical protein
MGATEELRILAVRKAAVRARIAARRTELSIAAAGLAGPFRLLEQGAALWRAVPGAARAAIPAGLEFSKIIAPKVAGTLGLLKYAPLAMRAAQKIAGWGKRT